MKLLFNRKLRHFPQRLSLVETGQQSWYMIHQIHFLLLPVQGSPPRGTGEGQRWQLQHPTILGSDDDDGIRCVRAPALGPFPFFFIFFGCCCPQSPWPRVQIQGGEQASQAAECEEVGKTMGEKRESFERGIILQRNHSEAGRDRWVTSIVIECKFYQMKPK